MDKGERRQDTPYLEQVDNLIGQGFLQMALDL